MKHFVITIARGFGSGGKDIGYKAAEKLGIPCYEREILTMASNASGLNEEVFARADDASRKIHFMGLRPVPIERKIYPEDRDFISDSNLFSIQKRIIEKLASEQSCIIIGKCADYILQENNRVLSIFIDAPLEACINSITEKMNVSSAEAKRLIERTDRYRSDYYKYYTGGLKWRSPDRYHMIMNSDKLGRDHCAEIIEQISRKRFM